MKYDAIIIGGGIVGLASAYQLLTKNPSLKLCLLEKEQEVAKHQTGNNSGVIHSGLYYKPGSLKAINCINGYKMLLAFCQQEDIPYELCGKVVVATEENEIPRLEKLYETGLQNGLDKIQMLSQSQIKEHEPHIAGLKGIWVPYTGIINYKKVSLKLAERIQELGGEIHLGRKVESIRPRLTETNVITQLETFQATLVINCAGLYSDKIAAMTTPNVQVRIIPFRGEYYELKPEKAHLIKNLVYPVPDPAFPFLGVHFTRMIEGGVEAGPNAVFSFRKEGYHKADFDLKETLASISWPGFQKVALKYWQTGLGEMYRSFSKPAFTKALQKLLPEIQEDDLLPGGAGVRAQACDRKGGLLDDFKILETNQVINVLNAPSPAATSSLSIGQTIADMALKKLGVNA